ncbi:hypothetical protein [Candidatus Methanomethylophilus sp. 1R26]|nr:hypothetical protein [Candidatus Methanomethylophilus sp. 1R26]
MLSLNRCPKCSKETGIRVVPPEDTLSRIIPLMKRPACSSPRHHEP